MHAFIADDRCYSDGPLPADHPRRAEAERAFREAFVSAACAARQWLRPEPFEIDHAREQRERARRHAEVHRDAETFYRPGHEVLAAYTRGRHHALEFARLAWDRPEARRGEVLVLLDRWLAAVRRWATDPLDDVTAPPGPNDLRPEPNAGMQ